VIISRPSGLAHSFAVSALPSTLSALTGRFLSRSIWRIFCGIALVTVSVATPASFCVAGNTSIARSAWSRCSAARSGAIGPPDSCVVGVIGGSPGLIVCAAAGRAASARAEAARSR
jgi:hypothetical protein